MCDWSASVRQRLSTLTKNQLVDIVTLLAAGHHDLFEQAFQKASSNNKADDKIEQLCNNKKQQQTTFSMSK
jgi:pheromone shutdown protein TraB